MNEQTEEIIEILRRVPEKKLSLIDLANKIPIKGGSFDVDAVMDMKPEINRAISEARAYSDRTKKAVSNLLHLPSSRPATLVPATMEDITEALTTF